MSQNDLNDLDNCRSTSACGSSPSSTSQGDTGKETLDIGLADVFEVRDEEEEEEM